MKKLKLLFLFTFILLIGIVGFNTKSQANSISKISMDIYLNNNGDATVTEVWNCSVNLGTEVYHPYYNLGNSEITNLTVSDESTEYTTLSSWDTSGTLSSKAYKCGINEISNGVELCWGISEYGSHTYTVKYEISSFVSELSDSQMIYWTLIPYDFSNSIGDVQIKIYADFYIEDTIDVWGYGNYGGLCYVSDGAIYMTPDRKLDTDEYMTILAKFPLGTFNTTNTLNHDFEYYYDMAEEGSTKYNHKWKSIFSILVEFLPIIFVILMILVAAKIRNNGLQISKETKKAIKKPEYYRDIPCNGDLYKSYYIAQSYGLLKNKTDLLGAIILKWLKQGIVKINKVEAGMIKKREDTAIEFIFEMKEKISGKDELKLFEMMNEASQDGILEKNEFEKWCSKNYSKILNWFDTILENTKLDLVEEGLIEKIEQTSMKIFKSTKYMPMQQLDELALQLAGLKRYLLDYTLIKQRESLEVTLFEDYLIYAQLMGIAEKVSKEFKNLYPDLIEQSQFSSYDDILFIHYCATSGMTKASSARAAAESYSSGGGGFSSGGGGGGSFGGGGGRRRFPLKLKTIKKIVYKKRL